MVLVRLQSQQEKLKLRRAVVPWNIADDLPVIQSVESLLPDLTEDKLTVSDFIQRYELWCNSRMVDLYVVPAASGIVPGAEVFVATKRPRAADPPSNRTADIATSSSLSHHVSGGAPRDATVAFNSFLKQHHLAHTSPGFVGIGVRTLKDLCCRTAQQLGTVLGDDLLAYRLISAAHATLKAQHADMDWAHRIGCLYQTYNPAKVSQVRTLLQAYSGEEEELWRSMREKYEPELAAKAATMETLTSPHSGLHNGPSLVSPPRAVDASPDGSVIAPASALVRSAAAPLTEVVHCPACRHAFVKTGHVADAVHAAEMDSVHRAAQQDLEESHKITTELSDAVEKLTAKLADSQQVARHYESVCREQEQWIKLLEQRITELAPPQTHNVFASSKGAIVEPVEASGGGGNAVTKPLSIAEKAKLRRRLVEFYLKYSPERVEHVDVVLQQWAGREVELQRLIAIEPTVVRISNTTPAKR